MLGKFLIAAVFGMTGTFFASSEVIPTPYRPIETIFEADSINVSGRIEGYDPGSGLKVMQLVIEDIAVGRTTPIALPIKPDGSFGRRFLLPMAQLTYISADRGNYFDVYLEPHNDIEVQIDYDKWVGRQPDALTFGGSLGKINAEINACPVKSSVFFCVLDPNTDPWEAKRTILAQHEAEAGKVEAYIRDNNVSAKAAQIMRNSALVEKAADLFTLADQHYSGPLLPEDFYLDFLSEALRADSTILAAGSFVFLNRLGFSRVLPAYRYDVNVSLLRPAVDFFAENGIELTDDDRALIRNVADIESPDSIQECTFMDLINMQISLIEGARRGNKEQEYMDRKFFDGKTFTKKDENNNEFIRRVCDADELPLIWQFAVTAREARNNPEDFLPEITSKYEITNQYLIDRVTDAATPKPGAWKLPDSEAGQLMQQLIEPYRGKYLLVDFWDITCGPCRAKIEANKERRERHVGNPGFAFLFLASEKGSPLDLYNAYVEKNLKNEHVRRLSEDQMMLLRELFEFNAIPRCVLFNPEGEVVNSDSNNYDFWELLKEKGIIDESEDN